MTESSTGVLSPSDRFLLAAANGAPPTPRLAEWIGAPGFSWEQVLEAAASNRIADVVARLALSKPLAAFVDEATRAKWVESGGAVKRRAQAASRELRTIGDAMARRGVAPLLYKGLDFEALCYPTGIRRAFNDIDIIVRPDDVDAAADALLAEGYDLPPGNPTLDYYRKFHLHAIFLDRNRRRLPVELHWALESPHAAAPDVLPLIFERVATDADFGSALRPDPVDALALMARHLEKHLGLSATLGTREARLASVIEGHGLLWLLDVVLWMRKRAAIADGEAVLARIDELAAEGALATSLRLALDLDPSPLPTWAVDLGERLPGPTPLITRVVYPDLHAGGPPGARARRLRDWGFRTLPEVGFAPLNAIQALLPSPTVPGTTPLRPMARLRRIPGKLRLIVANMAAVVRWRLDRWRAERRTEGPVLGRDASPHQPSE